MERLLQLVQPAEICGPVLHVWEGRRRAGPSSPPLEA
jgi:hypothetical protein